MHFGNFSFSTAEKTTLCYASAAISYCKERKSRYRYTYTVTTQLRLLESYYSICEAGRERDALHSQIAYLPSFFETSYSECCDKQSDARRTTKWARACLEMSFSGAFGDIRDIYDAQNGDIGIILSLFPI